MERASPDCYASGGFGEAEFGEVGGFGMFCEEGLELLGDVLGEAFGGGVVLGAEGVECVEVLVLQRGEDFGQELLDDAEVDDGFESVELLGGEFDGDVEVMGV